MRAELLLCVCSRGTCHQDIPINHVVSTVPSSSAEIICGKEHEPCTAPPSGVRATFRGLSKNTQLKADHTVFRPWPLSIAAVTHDVQLPASSRRDKPMRRRDTKKVSFFEEDLDHLKPQTREVNVPRLCTCAGSDVEEDCYGIAAHTCSGWNRKIYCMHLPKDRCRS